MGPRPSFHKGLQTIVQRTYHPLAFTLNNDLISVDFIFYRLRILQYLYSVVFVFYRLSTLRLRILQTLHSTYFCLLGTVCSIAQTLCSGPWKPGSRCRLSKAHNWFGETPGGREFGMGKGRSVYKQPGTKVTGSHHAKGGFPSK